MPSTNNILPRVSLATAGFTPATFRGAVFTPQQPDMNLLARSLDKIEEREEKLATQRLALDEAFSKARAVLPDNEETNQYITDSQNRIRDNIDAMINIGDYAGALNSARLLAGDFISSPEYNARVKEHESRKDWLKQLDNTKADDYVKEYFKDIYQDRNNFTYDNKGNVTGTAGWEAPLPAPSQNPTAVIQTAVKATADERIDSGRSWSNADGTGGGNTTRRETLTAEKISQTAMSIVNDPQIRQSFIDQYNAGIHQITKLTGVLNELNGRLQTTTDENVRKSLESRIASINNQIAGYENSFYKNGAPIGNANDYIKELFSPNNPEIRNAAYDYEHRNNVTNNTASNRHYGDDYGPGAQDLQSGGSDMRTDGTSVRYNTPDVQEPAKGNRNNLQNVNQ